MSCIHKFSKDLNLEQLGFSPETLVVGTFNPGWEHLGNEARWFYGRTRNNYFWDILPRLYGKSPLRQASPAEWKAFCSTHRIALTDLIARIDDADPGNLVHINALKNYRDDLIVRHFRQFNFVDIPSLLTLHPTLRHVYLTRSATDPFWKQRWQPVVIECRQRGIKTQTLLTPSGGARFQVPKKGVRVSLADFIFEQWQSKWFLD